MITRDFESRATCFGCFMTSLILLTSFDDVTPLLIDDDNCTNPCDYHGQTFCGHIPCPLPPCDRPLAWNPGDCCQHCPSEGVETMTSDVEPVPTLETTNVTAHFCPFICTMGNTTVNLTMASDVELVPTLETKNVTTHFCPFPCTMGNTTVCYPPPCPPPACVNPALHKPTDCCQYCPDGPNCRAPDGSIVKYDHWKMVHDHNCTCQYPSQDTTCV